MKKVAVIGTGSIGMRHLECLRQIPGVEPIAIAVRSARLRELQEQGFVTTGSLRESGASMAVIATDTHRHASDASTALGCGMDVLVEKPLTTDSKAARDLCRMAAEGKQLMFVGCVLRFSDSLNTCRSLLPRLGPLHSVRVECNSYLPDWRPSRPYRASYSSRAEEGGVLRDLIHEIDYAGWLFGWPNAVQARVRNLGRLGIQADEIAEMFWETDTGTLVSVSVDYLSRPTSRRMRVAGELGELQWDAIAGKVTLAVVSEPVREIISKEQPDEMFSAQLSAFIRARSEEVDPRQATAEEGFEALAVCDAARRASETRREEKVERL